MSQYTNATWEEKFRQATQTAERATKHELSKSYSQAFESYVRSGQLFLWLVRNIPSHRLDLKDKLKRNAVKVMERAEKIKSLKHNVRPVERQALNYEEQSLTLSLSAQIGKLTFPAWTEPKQSEFEEPRVYEDHEGQPALSPLQLENGVTYQRTSSQKVRDAAGFGLPLNGKDIVQDVVTDCSFVAALKVAAEHDRKWNTHLATSSLYPKNATGSIGKSPNGKYVVRLLINGTPRRITIDNHLPSYSNGRLMCATSRTGQQSWPALLEKAYLKVMGGYDFLGSNSSVDLHALTGWIPEHVFLRHAGFQREKMWKRILAAWKKGDCMITAGTGHFGEKASPSLEGLVPSHDYAVLQLIERGSRRYVELMNPWSRAGGKKPSLAVDQDEDDSACFLVSWDDLCSHFDSIYLNWNPKRFQHELTIHSIWKGRETWQSVGQNPQFRLSVETEGDTDIWLLLVRHIKGKQKQDQQSDYMALHVFEHEEHHRLYKPHSGSKLGAYVDGTHNLVRFTGNKPSYTIVVSRHGPKEDVGYSLSAYSSAKLSITELPHAYPYHEKVDGSWSGRSAGGNVTYPTFMNNPQYQVTIESPNSLLLLLEAARELPIQAQLVWSNGQRISHCVEGDVVMSSGMYNHGIALAEANSLQAGTYTLILSTFEPDQQGPFALRVECSAPIRLVPISQEGAGMYSRTLRDGWIPNHSAHGSPSNASYNSNPSYTIKVTNHSLFQIRLKTHRQRPYINIAIFSSGKEVASSGPYVDHVCGVSIDKLRLQPGSYTLIASTFKPNVECDFTLEVYSDRPIDVGRITL